MIPGVQALASGSQEGVNASQIRIGAKDCVARLAGVVPKQAEREMAELDAWYVFGVDGVENEIEVKPVEPTGTQG